MGVKLSKGGKVSLSKAAADSGVTNFSRLKAGCSWDANQFETGGDNDLDLSAFKCGANGKCRTSKDFVFYFNREATGIKHSGDERKGEKEGDDEVLTLDLNVIESDVEKIAFAVTIDEAEKTGKNFGSVVGAAFHLYDPDTGTDIVNVDLNEDFSTETAIVIGELYRHNGEWKFTAIEQGWSGGLKALCDHFGIETE